MGTKASNAVKAATIRAEFAVLAAAYPDAEGKARTLRMGESFAAVYDKLGALCYS